MLDLLAVGANPDTLAITHDPRHPRPGHDCRPRVRAVCAECGQEYVLCRPSDAEIRRMLGRVWACYVCEVTTP